MGFGIHFNFTSHFQLRGYELWISGSEEVDLIKLSSPIALHFCTRRKVNQSFKQQIYCEPLYGQHRPKSIGFTSRCRFVFGWDME